MTDILNRPADPQMSEFTPHPDASVEKWIVSDPTKAVARRRGIKVQDLIRDGLPLSPREAATVTYERAKLEKDVLKYKQAGTPLDEATQARTLVEKVGGHLTAKDPEKPVYYDDEEERAFYAGNDEIGYYELSLLDDEERSIGPTDPAYPTVQKLPLTGSEQSQ